MNLFLEDEEDASLLDVQSVIIGHLEKLIEEFDKYIPDGELHEKYKWLCRPFDVQVFYPKSARGAHRGAT